MIGIQVIRSTPGEYKTKQLHELACLYTEEAFKGKGATPPVWALAGPGKIMWVVTPWDGEREKNMVAYVLRKAMNEFQIYAYSFISEAWVSKTLDPDKVKQVEKRGVRSLPEDERDDVVMIFTHDRQGGFLHTQYKVTLTHVPGKLNFLGPRVDEEWEAGSTTGRMWNLFTERTNV